ncbi:MAG: iron-sulfur cluster assembly scaffold protein [Robiginitomaculum sp.]|nr:MAG: iron-sulfur cluster assembly scaffold protein [Robiginitomaculum sp.]
MDDLYNTDVLSLAANIKHIGRLENLHGTSRKVSKLCGSWLEVDVIIEQDRVKDFAMRLQACALGQASAAILAENVIGASLEELQAARDALFAMLKHKATPPEGRFAQLALLSDVANYPARHTSTLLAFDAVVEAVQSAQT